MKIFHTVLVILIITTTLFDKDCEAQWVQTNGPFGGSVVCFAFSGANIYAGTYIGGVFLSTNNGLNWAAVNNGLTNLDIHTLTISGTKLFAGTWGGGVFVSTNNGSIWTAINNGLMNLNVHKLAVSGTSIFAGTRGGLYVSTNSGISWTTINNGLTNLEIMSFAVSEANLFAGTYGGGTFLSTNNGANWTAINSGLTHLFVRALTVSGGNLFAGTNGGVYLSTNNGISWTAVNNGLINLGVFSFTVSGGNLFAGTNGGVYLSTNNGTSWISVNNGLTSQYIYALAVSGPNIFAGVNSGGIFLSTNNGINWVSVNSGLSNSVVRALIVSGENIFAGTGGGVFLSSNNGATWEALNNGLTNQYVNALTFLGTKLFAGTGGGVFLSTNNGSNWTEVNNGLNNHSINSFAVLGTNIFVGTEDGVFLSTNNGTNWNPVNNGITNLEIFTFAVSGINIFAGTLVGVFKSTNNGLSWNAVNNGFKSVGIETLSFSGTNLFAGTGSGLYLSTNYGAQWNFLFNELTNHSVHILGVSGINIFAGTDDIGVYLSTNTGTNWVNINQGFNLVDNVFAILAANNYLFAGIAGQSVWKRPLSDITSLMAPANLIYDPINNKLNWTLSPSPSVVNYLVYKKGSDNIWKSVADSGGILNSAANFYNIQTSGFNFYKVAAISNSGDTAKSDSIYVNRGYVLKKWNSGIIEPYKIKKHSFNFGNTTDNMWPSTVYSHYNNYSQPPYPRELFMKKRGPFWVTKIHSRAFSDWNLFTNIFGNETCYLHHGSNPPQSGDVFNKKAVDIWYSSLRNNRFYDGLISDFPGVCVGFSIASALSFSNNTSFYNQFPVMSNVDSVFGLTLSGGNGNDIRKVINHLGAINYVIPMPQQINSTSPRVILSQIIDSLSVVRSIDKQFKMVLGLADKKSGKFVHAVFPYAVEKDITDNNKFYIYLYDSNRPGNENKRLFIDTNLNKCSYDDFIQYNQDKLTLYASVDKYLGIQKLPGIDRLEFNKNKTENIFTTLFTSNKNSILIIDPLTIDTVAGYRNSDSTLFENPGRVIIPMTDGRFNIPQSYSIPLQNTNIFMKDFVSDSSGIFFSYFADTNTFIRYERYDSISSDQTDIIRIVNGSLSMYNPDALVKKISLTSIISRNSTINIQKTFEVNNFGLNYQDSVSSIIIDTSEMKLQNYGQQSSYNLSLIYSDSSTSKYFNHLNIIIPENTGHIVSPVWDSITTQLIHIYVDIGNNGTIDDTILINNIITTSEEGLLHLPNQYSLYQNYPNPFNPSTIVKYNIKSDGMVSLKVYNILGKEVTSLVNEIKRAGRYEVEFNGSNLSSGIYYYRLESGEYSETRKMLLLK